MKKPVYTKILLLYILFDQLFFRFLLFPLLKERMSSYGYQGTVILSELLLLGVIAVSAAKPLLQEIHVFQSKPLQYLCTALITAAMILAAEMLFGMLIKRTGAVSINQSEADLMKQTELFRFTFETLLYAPLLEETVFRGVLFDALKSHTGKVLSAVICSFLFGIIHMETALAAGNLSGFIYLPLYMLAGYLLYLGREKSGSLITCMSAHAFVNLFVLIF